MAWFVPDPVVGAALSGVRAEKNRALDDLATVIFSSGSTGEPKGVMLSHYNIGSNIEQMEQVFGLDRRDGFLGILPFFHSFGFTGTLCLPAVLGVGVVYHPNPLDAKTIGPLVCDHAVTFLLATPTFLQLYLRGCARGGFRQPARGDDRRGKIARPAGAAFEEQFGIRPARRLRLHRMRAGGGGEHARISAPPASARSAASAARSAIRCPASACASWTRKTAERNRCRSASPACCWCAGRT